MSWQEKEGSEVVDTVLTTKGGYDEAAFGQCQSREKKKRAFLDQQVDRS